MKNDKITISESRHNCNYHSNMHFKMQFNVINLENNNTNKCNTKPVVKVNITELKILLATYDIETLGKIKKHINCM